MLLPVGTRIWADFCEWELFFFLFSFFVCFFFSSSSAALQLLTSSGRHIAKIKKNKKTCAKNWLCKSTTEDEEHEQIKVGGTQMVQEVLRTFVQQCWEHYPEVVLAVKDQGAGVAAVLCVCVRIISLSLRYEILTNITYINMIFDQNTFSHVWSIFCHLLVAYLA